MNRRNRHKAAVLILALIVLAHAWPVTAAEPSRERQGELVYRLLQDCGSCHGMTLKGGLGPALLPARLAGIPDAALIETILDGRPGTPMPPWKSEITESEAGWLVGLLKKGLEDAR